MKVHISHPTSNEFNRNAAYGLQEAGMLLKFHTGLACFPGSLLDQLGKFGPLSEIRRRRFDPAIKSRTSSWPWFEIGRQISMKADWRNLTRHETGFFSVDAVYKNLDKKVASGLTRSKENGATAVYAYQDGAYYSFQKAKSLGLDCLYDLPIGYWRAAHRLMQDERTRWPEWASTITGLSDSDAKLARQDAEIEMADKIFVASQFTANTLKDYPGKLAPVKVVPYGFPKVSDSRTYQAAGRNGKPLKILYVGSLSQRKGIADLFSAVEQIGSHIELTIVGHKASEHCIPLDEALARHRWIPSLPHDQILKLMKQHDILVFPSLFEGFGLVISEAMSQGTPVITTERTAGPDLITHGENGWLVNAGSTPALREAIEHILLHPETIEHAGRAAMETAGKRSWDVYQKELAAAICEGI